MIERERFEAWAHGNGWATSRYYAKTVKRGDYRNWHVEAAWQAWQARCPNEWQCVPIEPTEEMVDAASEAYMPFGDMALAIQAAIVYAPEGDQ